MAEFPGQKRASQLVTEFTGTLLLCLTVALSAKQSTIAPIAIGFILMTMVYAGAHSSGANYNPAVTVALMVRGCMDPLTALFYIVTQILGAISATLLSWAMIGKSESGYPALGSETGDGAACLGEFVITYALCFVVLHTATSKAQANNSYYGLAIGCTVLSGAISVGPFSGGAFNPAVGFMSVLYGGKDAEKVWIYLLGPFLGAIAAGIQFRFVKYDEFTDEPNAVLDFVAPLIIEAVGTALLCFTVGLAGGNGSFLAPLSIGSMLMVVVYAGGEISGGHYNPAVTLGVFLRSNLNALHDDFGPRHAAKWVLSQIVGALIGAACAWGVWESNVNMGYPAPPEGELGKAFLGEVIGTFTLVLVVLNVATVKQTKGNSFFGLAIGQTVTALAVGIGPVSGGAFNPAVGLIGPYTGGQNAEIEHVWIYWLACPIGAVIAAAVFRAQNYEEFKPLVLGEKNKFFEFVSEDAAGDSFQAHSRTRKKVPKTSPNQA
mmetsp:Transcript_37989/g.80768  ORF Transcript_37989/g.80768 Transcript_37989/m.80768 type:complete len:490 (-) Transcript_37989:104-1573(-)